MNENERYGGNRELNTIADQIKSLIELVPAIENLGQQLADNPTNIELQANVAFVCSRSKDVLEAIEKLLNKLDGKAAVLATDLLPKYEGKKYGNENVTISDNSGFYVKYPHSPDQPGYAEFVRQLPPEAVRPHYNTVVELITKTVAEGGQIPFGLPPFGIASVLPKLRVFKKKEL